MHVYTDICIYFCSTRTNRCGKFASHSIAAAAAAVARFPTPTSEYFPHRIPSHPTHPTSRPPSPPFRPPQPARSSVGPPIVGIKLATECVYFISVGPPKWPAQRTSDSGDQDTSESVQDLAAHKYAVATIYTPRNRLQMRECIRNYIRTILMNPLSHYRTPANPCPNTAHTLHRKHAIAFDGNGLAAAAAAVAANRCVV